MSNPGKNKIQVRKQYIETLPPEVKLQDVAVPGGDQAGLLHCLNGTQWTLSLSWDLKLKRLKKKTAVTTMIQCFIVTNALAARATGVYVNRKWTQGLGWKTSIQQTMPTTREEVSFVNIYFIWRRKEQHGVYKEQENKVWNLLLWQNIYIFLKRKLLLFLKSNPIQKSEKIQKIKILLH